MEKILFFGDSITDACRVREPQNPMSPYGFGYVMQIVGKLAEKNPIEYEVINKGISGDRIVDLYSRIKKDVWNQNPDVLTILVGVNDVWHEIFYGNGVEIDRFEKIYRILIEDTKKVLPNTRIILCEPFFLLGSATEENYNKFKEVLDYAKVVKAIAKDYDLEFLPLQEKFDEAAKKYGATTFLWDGVHPSIPGATLIANEWMTLFENNKEKK